MPNPTPGSLHLDSWLTDVSVAFIQSATAFVADKVFPFVPVQKKSDVFATYSQADFNRDEMFVRAPGGAPNRIGYGTGRDSYICDEWAVEHAIDDQVRANADSPFSPEEDATRLLTHKALLKREKNWITTFFSTGNLWTGSSDAADLVSGTDFTAWSNAASNPINDINDRKVRIEKKTGFLPNTLVIGRQSWYDLKEHPDLVDRLKYTSSDSVGMSIVAKLFELDRILVASAVENTAAEGMPHVGAYCAGDNALLVYTPSSPSLMTPAGGYTFGWTGLIGSNQGMAVDSYREERTLSDVVRVRNAYAQKQVAPSVGVLFSNCSTKI